MRKVQFLPNATRIYVKPTDVVTAWRSATTVIDARYALGTAQHESDFTINEVDTEDSGFVSLGIFQLSEEEKIEARLPSADLLTLGDSVDVMTTISVLRLSRIMAAGNLLQSTPDCLAYLSIAHNQGLGACLETIKAHGLDWSAYKSRNLAEAKAAGNMAKLAWWGDVFAYGDDCISGGMRWSADFD